MKHETISLLSYLHFWNQLKKKKKSIKYCDNPFTNIVEYRGTTSFKFFKKRKKVFNISLLLIL